MFNSKLFVFFSKFLHSKHIFYFSYHFRRNWNWPRGPQVDRSLVVRIRDLWVLDASHLIDSLLFSKDDENSWASDDNYPRRIVSPQRNRKSACYLKKSQTFWAIQLRHFAETISDTSGQLRAAFVLIYLTTIGRQAEACMVIFVRTSVNQTPNLPIERGTLYHWANSCCFHRLTKIQVVHYQ